MQGSLPRWCLTKVIDLPMFRVQGCETFDIKKTVQPAGWRNATALMMKQVDDALVSAEVAPTNVFREGLGEAG